MTILVDCAVVLAEIFFVVFDPCWQTDLGNLFDFINEAEILKKCKYFIHRFVRS